MKEPVSEEVMKIVREKGEKMVLNDDKIITTGYLYEGYVYIDDVELVENGNN